MNNSPAAAKTNTPKARRKKRPETIIVIGGVEVKLMPLHKKGTLPWARVNKAIREIVALRSATKPGHAKRS